MIRYILLAALLLVPQSSFAMKELYSPIVEEGQLNVEIEAEQYQDENLAILDNYKAVETDLRYGISDRFGAGLELTGSEGATLNEDFGYDISGFEGMLQFTEQVEGKGLASGLRAEYELNHSGTDRVNAALMFDYMGESFRYLINAGLYTDINGDAATDKDLVGDIRVGVRYMLSSMFQPGVEYYSDTGELDELNDFDDQTQNAGPAVYGSLTNNFYYEAGYLYGLTESSPDSIYKFGIGYKYSFDEFGK